MHQPLEQLKVVIVHDWLTTVAGSEKVLQHILTLFPNADLFTLVDHLPANEREFLNGRSVRTSFLQKLPWSAKLFRKLLWMHPSAVETFDVSQYDLVISSCHAVAKGVLTRPDQLHICYCHSPIRYAWDLQHQYLRQAGLERGIKSLYARATLHYLRLWDVRTANGVDHFIANSRYIASRIHKVYRRHSIVVHPPVEVDDFPFQTQKGDYYLAASRMVPYKRMDLVVQAFARMPNRKLLVVGDGPELANCRKLASSNVEFLGYQKGQELQRLMSNAKAFVFAAEEDFGIIIVEAQACGTPVICFKRGGALDSVVAGETGVFFDEQSAESILEAVKRFEGLEAPLDPYRIRAHAEHFGSANFRCRFRQVVDDLWKAHVSRVRNTTPIASDSTWEYVQQSYID